VSLAASAEVAVRTVTLPYLLLFIGGAHACWFCSDCCWSL